MADVKSYEELLRDRMLYLSETYFEWSITRCWDRAYIDLIKAGVIKNAEVFTDKERSASPGGYSRK
jgi:hypothetical protein